MTTAKGARFLSPAWGLSAGTPTFQNHTCDATNDGVGWIFQSQSTEAITHLGFRYGARTGTPPTYIIGLEGIAASTGSPDGTNKTNGGNCSGTFTPPASTAWDGLWQWVALSNSYTPTLGELLAITIRHSTGTVDASNYSSFTSHVSNVTPGRQAYPYSARLTAATWAKNNIAAIFGVRTGSLRYGVIFESSYTTTTAATTGHRVAAKIVVPAGFGSTFKLAGVRFVGQLVTGSREVTLNIWNSGGTVLNSVTLDTDMIASNFNSHAFEFIFSDLIELNFGDTYYIGLEVGSPTSAVAIYGTAYSSSSDFADTDGGSAIILSNFNGTSWTDSPTIRPLMELIVDDWTEPSSSGGAMIGPMRVIQSAGRRR